MCGIQTYVLVSKEGKWGYYLFHPIPFLTCVPHILHPDVCTGGKEEPLDRDEEVTDDVRRDGHTHKEHREGLQRNEETYILM